MVPCQDGAVDGPVECTLGEAVVRAGRMADSGVRRILGLTGPPGGGKSTVAAALVGALDTGAAVVVPMDGFHLAQAELERLGRADRKGAPDTFDAAGFVALLERLARQPGSAAAGRRGAPDTEAGGTIWAPVFRREIEEPIANAVPVEPGTPLVVVEGNYLLLSDGAWAGVRPLLDECWYVSVPDDVRLARLIARHVAHGRSPAAATAWVHRSDEANARAVAATRARADVVVTLT
jgi:pantothenate kinase